MILTILILINNQNSWIIKIHKLNLFKCNQWQLLNYKLFYLISMYPFIYFNINLFKILSIHIFIYWQMIIHFTNNF